MLVGDKINVYQLMAPGGRGHLGEWGEKTTDISDKYKHRSRATFKSSLTAIIALVLYVSRRWMVGTSRYLIIL